MAKPSLLLKASPKEGGFLFKPGTVESSVTAESSSSEIRSPAKTRSLKVHIGQEAGTSEADVGGEYEVRKNTALSKFGPFEISASHCKPSI